ncbi:hypothetical protein Pcaca03_16610 [Pectobacterium carotovorum subsp. carotovorum]|uniref:Uncharacterized protein n=1 Tax=Pectobacterium carotovorum subsp. carotovorum TaxID=555 RepID=A0AAI9KZZ4_PECCC|nr:hypothetical protein SOASR016_15230 [Pectobacterium carotovorum subsp. carotovorum]GLV69217.1 hypothetical protein Pcaca03_16610 [Pectobacterium carotovorum subsp. carotovorum]
MGFINRHEQWVEIFQNGTPNIRGNQAILWMLFKRRLKAGLWMKARSYVWRKNNDLHTLLFKEVDALNHSGNLIARWLS